MNQRPVFTVAAVPGKRPGGYEIRAFLRRLVGAIRAFWPRVEILLRADSHYACPEVFDWCRENRVDWVLGLAPNAALRRHVEALEKTTAERFTVAPARGKVRRFAQFHDAAGSWSRVERIIARATIAGSEDSCPRADSGRPVHQRGRPDLQCPPGNHPSLPQCTPGRKSDLMTVHRPAQTHGPSCRAVSSLYCAYNNSLQTRIL